MCLSCGCSEGATPRLEGEHAHDQHDHSHEHGHAHGHRLAPSRLMPPRPPAGSITLKLEQDILAKNNRLAEENRAWLAARKVLALNLISAPGAGKTSLLERVSRDLAGELSIAAVEGDQETARDAERLRAAGVPAVQINTGAGCHLDAVMVRRGLERLDPAPGALVAIENVGNLVCPALFDLGEHAKVVLLSVTEGEDKPLKYPHAFRAAEVMILSKIDLLPYVPFDPERCLAYARQVNPRLQIFPVSAARGEGLGAWYAWLRARLVGLTPESAKER
jgi:hydrogenase nickel incorporation protein HypB